MSLYNRKLYKIVKSHFPSENNIEYFDEDDIPRKLCEGLRMRARSSMYKYRFTDGHKLKYGFIRETEQTIRIGLYDDWHVDEDDGIIFNKHDFYFNLSDFCQRYMLKYKPGSDVKVALNPIIQNFIDEYSDYEDDFETLPNEICPVRIYYSGNERTGRYTLYAHRMLITLVSLCISDYLLYGARALDDFFKYWLSKDTPPYVLREENKTITQQIAEIRDKHVNQKIIGLSGEDLVYELLKPHFPALAHVGNTPFSSDLYDVASNVRFEVKSKLRIEPRDYKKIEADDALRHPRLTVLISVSAPMKPHIHSLSPNILCLHVSDLENNMELWKSFILDSKWK